jgi:hypothetical protein
LSTTRAKEAPVPAEEHHTSTGVESIAKCLLETLGEKEVEAIARRCGLLKRLRDVTPLGLLVACISTLGTGEANWLADILRTYNAFTGKTVKYKPFHNQLRKTEFPKFLLLVLERILSKLTLPVLQGLPREKLAIFEDILAHDGTSFALKDDLAREFPGRFTRVSPAAVELHVTMSALDDNPISIVLAPDKESERHFAPTAESVRRRLLLEDRGFQDRRFFAAVQEAEGFYIVRGTKSIKPTIRRAYDESGRRLRHLEGKRLSWQILPRETVDLDIEWEGSEGPTYHGRLVAIYRPGKRNRKTYVYLHTNLARETFSPFDVGQLYRLRWQAELLFKEWKSHANLHGFDTSMPAIAQGLIWASLAAATLKRVITHTAEQTCGIELSTQRAARAGKHFLDGILKCLLGGGRSLKATLRSAFDYLKENARRAHPDRDRETGRLATGLRPIAMS